MQQFYLNKKLLTGSSFQNGSWKFLGDSVFTSSAIINGKIPWVNEHINRLVQSVNDYYFQGSLSENDLSKISDKIVDVTNYIEKIANGYIRITFYPNKKLAFAQALESINQLDCLWQIDSKQKNSSNLKKCTILDLGNISYPSNIKIGSYGVEHYWRRKIKKNDFDDYIRISGKKIYEASTSNIFFYLGEGLFVTPKIIDGILDGICRRQLIQFLKNSGFRVLEKDVDINILEESEEVFLTNAVSGISSISEVNDLKFKTKIATDLRNTWPWES